MAKISSLWVEIGANSAKFTAELKKTSRLTSAWARDIRKSVSNYQKAVKAAGDETRAWARHAKLSYATVRVSMEVTAKTAKHLGKAISGFMLTLTKSVAKTIAALGGAITGLYTINARWIDQMAKVSAKLGDVVSSVQAVKMAADFAGVGNSIETAMQRLVRRMGEAANGTGEALKAVKELGLNAGEIAQKTATEQLQMVLDKLQEIPPGAERVRLAFKFFDTEGAGLVNLTSQSIENARQELARWGVTINEQQAAWVESANDQMSRIGQFVRGVGGQFSANLAPYIGVVSQRLLDWGINTFASGEVINRVVAGIRKGFLLLSAGWDAFNLSALNASNAMTRFGINTVTQFQGVFETIAKGYNMIPGLEDIDPQSYISTMLESWAESLKVGESNAIALAQRLSSIRDENGNFTIEGSDYAARLNLEAEAFRAQAEAAKKVQIELQSQIAAGFTLPAVSANQPIFSPATNIKDRLKDDQKAQREHMRKMTDEARAVNAEVATLANMLGDGIKNSAEDASEAIRNMVADMLVHLTKLYFQGQINQAGSGGQSGIGGFLSGIVGGLMGFNSTPPAGATAASQSLSAGSTAAGYSAGVIQNIQVNASGESSTALSNLRAGVRHLSDASPSQVAQRAMRGGSYRQSFGR